MSDNPANGAGTCESILVLQAAIAVMGEQLSAMTVEQRAKLIEELRKGRPERGPDNNCPTENGGVETV